MKKLLLALSLVGFTTVSALAAGIPFDQVDANQDGGVTLEEANTAGLPWSQEQFSNVDTDQNGMLDVDEFAAATQ